jgi:hypothetical protein
MPPRTATRKVQIDESLLHSGDMLGIVRLDGLDPLIMWGTGSRLGHTAVVLKGEDGLVYVAESQDKTSYWPRGSIQKTPYAEWLSMAHAADYNVVWLPLSRQARARFNESAALEAFRGDRGLGFRARHSEVIRV